MAANVVAGVLSNSLTGTVNGPGRYYHISLEQQSIQEYCQDINFEHCLVPVLAPSPAPAPAQGAMCRGRCSPYFTLLFQGSCFRRQGQGIGGPLL